MVAVEAWGDIGSNHCPFHQQCSRAAHGVKQGAAAPGYLRPVGGQQNGSSQVLLERGSHSFQAVTAAVQAATGEVNTDPRFIFYQIKVDAQVRIVEVHRGALSKLFTETINNRVLGLEGGVLAMGDGGANAGAVNSETSA